MKKFLVAALLAMSIVPAISEEQPCEPTTFVRQLLRDNGFELLIFGPRMNATDNSFIEVWAKLSEESSQILVARRVGENMCFLGSTNGFATNPDMIDKLVDKVVGRPS